ncbi:hypothetical protein DV515_00001768 [Chloebia gouldiae]|uniref:Protein PTHB1 n=1 Tax=Chloebia gouldiae TaxID=44316 RepID=A0A3L8T2P7_CHLGU|nr:hypothetical protein DV515_00001768 [Chloebia gouldiae]
MAPLPKLQFPSSPLGGAWGGERLVPAAGRGGCWRWRRRWECACSPAALCLASGRDSARSSCEEAGLPPRAARTALCQGAVASRPTRDWWSTILGEKEEFDQGCLCVADVDNSGSGQDKVIVGSYKGYLRIFNPHPVKPGDEVQPEDLLLEAQLREPILQVEVGKFVSGTEGLHLAVLHCRKLCVYAVSGTQGNVEHGNQYQIKLMYEHNLQRTACNMTYGPFGGVKENEGEKAYICKIYVAPLLMFKMTSSLEWLSLEAAWLLQPCLAEFVISRSMGLARSEVRTLSFGSVNFQMSKELTFSSSEELKKQHIDRSPVGDTIDWQMALNSFYFYYRTGLEAKSYTQQQVFQNMFELKKSVFPMLGEISGANFNDEGKGRDLICIQSMDGMLMLFEQESYAFGRFLPGFLLPGPLAYSSRTDSFITVSSCQQVESYKYQVLAFATDADERHDTEQRKLSSGKRLVVDWVLNIGEQALDICVASFNQGVSSVFVLGERNFFCLKDNGQIRFMKKLDYNPSCFIPYCSVREGTINTLIANHNKMLNVYQDVTLKWATQIPCIPVSYFEREFSLCLCKQVLNEAETLDENGSGVLPELIKNLQAFSHQIHKQPLPNLSRVVWRETVHMLQLKQLKSRKVTQRKDKNSYSAQNFNVGIDSDAEKDMDVPHTMSSIYCDSVFIGGSLGISSLMVLTKTRHVQPDGAPLTFLMDTTGKSQPGFEASTVAAIAAKELVRGAINTIKALKLSLDLKGVIVTLSDDGHLQCSYLGTDPSLFQAPKVDSREINYEEMNAEMKELQKIIREATKTQDILPESEKQRDVIVTAEVSPDLDEESLRKVHNVQIKVLLLEPREPTSFLTSYEQAIDSEITIQSRVTAQKPSLAVCVQAPLAVTCDQFVFNDLEPDSSETVVLSVFLKENCSPPELEGTCMVSYNTPTGIPRVSQCNFSLPLKLVCIPAQPSKAASHKITIDTNKPPISFITIFPDFVDPSEGDQANALGFQFLGGSKTTLLASKTSQRYRIQSDQLEDLWLVTKELIRRLEEHFKKQNCKDFACTFSGSIPLQEYFELIDRHFELRLNAEKYQEMLSERAVQFRAIERRLLTRFKDKTPAPLQHLDTLLEGTFRELASQQVYFISQFCLTTNFYRLMATAKEFLLSGEKGGERRREGGKEIKKVRTLCFDHRSCHFSSPNPNQVLNLTDLLSLGKDEGQNDKNMEHNGYLHTDGFLLIFYFLTDWNLERRKDIKESLNKGGRSAGEIGSSPINQTHSSEKNEMRLYYDSSYNLQLLQFRVWYYDAFFKSAIKTVKFYEFDYKWENVVCWIYINSGVEGNVYSERKFMKTTVNITKQRIVNGICRKTNSKGAETKTLNARLRIGFMDTKEVQFHCVTPSENWLLGQSTLSCAAQQLQCCMLADSKLTFLFPAVNNDSGKYWSEKTRMRDMSGTSSRPTTSRLRVPGRDDVGGHKVIALADAAEENQANMFQAFAKLKSATHLVIMLISLWQKLSTDQIALLEATFLPLAEDTQELLYAQKIVSSSEQAFTLGKKLKLMENDVSILMARHFVLIPRLIMIYQYSLIFAQVLNSWGVEYCSQVSGYKQGTLVEALCQSEIECIIMVTLRYAMTSEDPSWQFVQNMNEVAFVYSFINHKGYFGFDWTYEGWEETVDAAVSYLLRTCLSKSSKEQALTLSSQLSMPKDTSRLKKNITLFCDRLAKGGRLSLSTDSATQQAAVMPVCFSLIESNTVGVADNEIDRLLVNISYSSCPKPFAKTDLSKSHKYVEIFKGQEEKNRVKKRFNNVRRGHGIFTVKSHTLKTGYHCSASLGVVDMTKLKEREYIVNEVLNASENKCWSNNRWKSAKHYKIQKVASPKTYQNTEHVFQPACVHQVSKIFETLMVYKSDTFTPDLPFLQSIGSSSGGCATIPESDLEERTIIPGSTAVFASHGQTTKQKSKTAITPMLDSAAVKSMNVVIVDSMEPPSVPLFMGASTIYNDQMNHRREVREIYNTIVINNQKVATAIAKSNLNANVSNFQSSSCETYLVLMSQKKGQNFKDLHQEQTQKGKSNQIDLIIGSTIKLHSFDPTEMCSLIFISRFSSTHRDQISPGSEFVLHVHVNAYVDGNFGKDLNAKQMDNEF